MTKELTSENFDELVLKAKTPVLVDFTKKFCPPCESIKPLLNEIAIEYEGRIPFFIVDVYDVMDIAINYGIRVAPTLFFFVDGKVVNKKLGYSTSTKREIKTILDKLLEGSLNAVKA